MKRAALAAVLALAASLAVVSSVQGQAEKIIQKSKDLKKQVEGGQTTTTNKPPQKTPPPPPPPSQKPAK